MNDMLLDEKTGNICFILWVLLFVLQRPGVYESFLYRHSRSHALSRPPIFGKWEPKCFQMPIAGLDI